MTMISEDSQVMQKTRELCQMLLDEPSMRELRQRIDTFMSDGKARQQYDTLVNKGQQLQEKQQNSVALTGDEIAEFEQERDSLLNNPIARSFIDAQEELHQVQKSIQKYVNKTIELGRMPTEDDLEGGCGSGCGCGHNH